jgi:hypothetical protein
MTLPPWYSTDIAGNNTVDSLKNHQRYTMKWCDSIYDEASVELNQNEEIVNIDKHIKYLMGKQWPDKRPTYKASPVANRTWPNLIQLVSYLTDIRQSFEVQAKNRQYNDTSRKINDMAKSWFIDQDVDMTTAMVIIYSALTVGYARQVWNQELNGGEGDIELTACGPLDVIPIKPSHTLQGAYGLIYEKPMPLSWFAQNYPLFGDLVQPDEQYSRYRGKSSTFSQQSFWYLGAAYRRLFGLSENPTVSSGIPMGRYREFWLRDYSVNTSSNDVYVGDMSKGIGYMVKPRGRLYPRGRLVITGGKVGLYDGPNPHWHGRFPFAALRINQVPWQWPGISEFRNQVPMQDVMNNILAGILDMVKKAVNPPVSAPLNAFSESMRKTMDPNMPGARLYYNPSAGQPPTWSQVAQLPGFVFQTLMYAREELTNQTGFIDQGSLSSKKIIPSADTMEQLGQSQQTLVRLKVRYIEAFFREIGEQYIANSFQYYRTSRRILTAGMGGLMWTDWTWNPSEICPEPLDLTQHWKTFKWTILPGSLLKSSRDSEKAVAMNMRRQGDMDRRNLFKVMDMEPLIDSVEQNLKAEGKDVITNMLRQKMSGMGGGGGLTPDVLEQLNQGTKQNPEPIM